MRAAVREPMAGEIRLQWWREVILRERDEEAAGHPVGAAIVHVLREAFLPAEPLLAAIEGYRDALYDDEAIAPEASGRSAIVDAAAQALTGAHPPNGLATHAGYVLAAADRLSAAGAAGFPQARDLAAHAQEHLRRAAEVIVGADRALRPVWLPLAPARVALARAAAGRPAQLTPLRRQWEIWRAARNPARLLG